MPTTNHGPFKVIGGEVDTGIQVCADDRIEITTTGTIDFGGAFLGIGAPIAAADGDDWATPSNYPAPGLRKNSLILRVGSSTRWFQAGTNSFHTLPMGLSGALVLRANDRDVQDNSRGWTVNVRLVRPDPQQPPPGPRRPVLNIVGIEVVQAVQRVDNSIRLLFGKQTAVRVYIDSGIRDGLNIGAGPNCWPRITGELSIKRASDGTPIGAAVPLNPGIAARPSFDLDRNISEHSLNFLLPLGVSFFSPIAIEVTLWPQNLPDLTANSSTIVSFESRPQQQLLPILIADEVAGLPAPTLGSWLSHLRATLPMVPMSQFGFIVNPPIGVSSRVSLDSYNGMAIFLSQLMTMAVISGTPVGGIRAGLVGDSGTRQWGGIGAARVGFTIPAFFVIENSAGSFPHEMGHSFGIGHADCGDPGGLDDRLPSDGRLDEPGVDASSGTVFPASQTPDFMSYCGPPEWISTQTYNILFDAPPV